MGLKYYADLNDALVTDLLRQASIKTNNHLMVFSDSSVWTILPTRIRKIHQVVLGFNIGLSQEISHWCIIQICIVFQAQSLVVPEEDLIVQLVLEHVCHGAP